MTIGIFILSGFVGWGTLSVRAARNSEYREQAFEIAEAGADYYRWHLAHAAADFQDGTATSGPYVHDYFDKSGTKIGTFFLARPSLRPCELTLPLIPTIVGCSKRSETQNTQRGVFSRL